MNKEWYSEEKIVECVCDYLVEERWIIEKIANTATRERGHDITARRDKVKLLVEVKGFPSTTYAYGEKQGQPKPTTPSTQARKWYSQAVLSAILTQNDHPEAISAIALPSFKTYIDLIRRSQHALIKLGIVVFLVNEERRVENLSDSSL